MEAARAMLHDQYLPMHLWAEASRTMVYVQNCTPHRVLKNKNPEEVFSGKKPEVIHLRIFGCPVYIHVQRREQSWILQEIRASSLDTMIHRRLTESIYLASRRTRLAEMSPLGFNKDIASSRSR